ncbi:YcaO-like family protein [Bacillus thuringiensis]|uniref:YcaO-like family protein n=1 Tax=Bacillus thuringiensis TaxID=1428 RepID=UPI000BF4E678|nr:YcaO-like family protein [Bacillus thuringiensis]PFU61942.1 hypothetical protein COK85_09985 [Bacillus thuringiensis]
MQNDIKFFYDNKDVCLVRENGMIFKIDTKNPALTVEIANKILMQEDLAGYDKDLVSEVSNFLNNNFNLCRSDMDNVFYSNDPRFKNSLSIEEFLSRQEDRVFLLNNLSPEKIKIHFERKPTNSVGIIDLDFALIVTPYFSNDSACLACLVERWIEANPKIYKYQIFHENNVHDSSPDFLYQLAITKANLNLVQQSEKAYIISKKDFTIQETLVLSREGCKVCFSDSIKRMADFNIGDRAYSKQGNGQRSNSYYDAYEVFRKMVNPLGPVVELEEYGSKDRLNIAVFQSAMSYNALQNAFPIHGGKGPDYHQARLSAIGEAMERYNSRHFGNEYIIRASYKELKEQGKNVLNPESLCLDKSYPYPYSEEKKIDWVESIDLFTFEKILVPANAVLFIYSPESNDLQIIPQDTTGLASGLNIEEAILQGILEVIERDAYAIYYRNQLTAKTLLIQNIQNAKLMNLIRDLNDNHVKLHLKYLETDTPVYVVHCVSEDMTGNFPIFTHGAGAALNIETAIMRAITEAVQLRTSQIEINDNKEYFSNDTEYEAYFEWGNGNLTYVGSLLSSETDPTIEASKLKDLSSHNFKKDIMNIVEHLNDNDYKVLVSDLTRKDNPISTVRVIIPGFQSTDDTLNRLTSRMTSLPQKLGLKVRDTPFDKPFFA